MLFVMVMEAITALIKRADELQLFTPLGPGLIKQRASLYADDMAIFLKPEERDLELMRSLLDLFAASTGLRTNVDKCQFSPIRCAEEDLDTVTRVFPCQLKQFLCRYLRIPLSIYKLPKSERQPLVDSIANRLPT